MAVDVLAHAGEDDDGDVVGGAACEGACDFKAVDVGEHEVQDDGVGVMLEGLVNAGLSGGGLKIPDVFEDQVFADEFVYFEVVFDDQNSHDGGLCLG